MHYLIISLLLSTTSGAYGQQEMLFDQLTSHDGLRYAQEQSQPYSGKAVAYYANGNKKFTINFRDGRRHGTEIAWDESGRMKHRIYYRQGKLQSYGSAWFNGNDKPKPISRFQPCYNPNKSDADCAQVEGGSRFEFAEFDSK